MKILDKRQIFLSKKVREYSEAAIRRVLYKGALKNFAKITEKHMKIASGLNIKGKIGNVKFMLKLRKSNLQR